VQQRVYAALIHSALDRIASDPDGLGSKPCDELWVGLRSLHLARVAHRQSAASHVIFYMAKRDSEGAWSITVVRVLHERMDPERHITA
jgi:toxin ParE1/3/4